MAQPVRNYHTLYNIGVVKNAFVYNNFKYEVYIYSIFFIILAKIVYLSILHG